MRLTYLISSGAEIHSLVGEAFADFLAQVPPMAWVHWLWAALILIGSVWLAWQARQHWGRPQADAGFIVLLWLWGPALFFLYATTPIFIHYFIATLPAQYIAAAVGLVALARRATAYLNARPTHVLRFTFYALLATAVFQLYTLGALLVFVRSHATPGGFGTPLARKLAAAEAAQHLVATTAATEVIAVGPGTSPAEDDFPAVYDVLLRATPHRFADVTQTALFPAHAAVVLLDTSETEIHVGALYEEAAVSAATFPLRAGEGELQVLALPSRAAPTPEHAFADTILLTNFVRFLGYTGPLVAEEAARWQVHWQTADNPDPRDFHIFNHLLNENGERIAQVDGAAFAGNQWQPGDVVVSHFVLPWPPGAGAPRTMRVGMYVYPQVEPVLLMDVAGNPYADAVEIEIREAADASDGN